MDIGQATGRLIIKFVGVVSSDDLCAAVHDIGIATSANVRQNTLKDNYEKDNAMMKA